MIHASCLVTGAIRIYYWYKNAELLTDSSDPDVNKWGMSILAQPFTYSLAGSFRLRQYDVEPILNRYSAFGPDEGPGLQGQANQGQANSRLAFSLVSPFTENSIFK